MTAIELRIDKEPATLRRRVEDRLRSAIATGHFRPGQRLVERELCEALGVSRTSLREAFRQLEADGLVVTVPHRGPEVASISAAEAAQLYELRALLESFAGRAFAERGSSEEADALSAAIDRFERAASAGDAGETIRAKTAFYRILLDGGRNVFVSDALRRLHDRITLLRVTSMTQPNRLPDSVRELRAIHTAIAARDPDAAATACRDHIENAARIALAVLTEPQDAGG